MKIITQRDIIKNVYLNWKQQYTDEELKNNPELKQVRNIGKKLKKLNLNKATKEEIDKIMGNDSWTSVFCDECNEYTDLAVEFSAGRYNTVIICTNCLATTWKQLVETLK